MAFDYDSFLNRVAGHEADKSGDPYMSRSAEKGGGGWGEARGKWQFRKSTWNGLGYADADIWNPQAQDAAAQRLAEQNYASLNKRFGREPSEGEMLHAWHYGAGAVPAGATEQMAYGAGYKGAHGSDKSAPLAQAAPTASGTSAYLANNAPAQDFDPQAAAGKALAGAKDEPPASAYLQQPIEGQPYQPIYTGLSYDPNAPLRAMEAQA